MVDLSCNNLIILQLLVRKRRILTMPLSPERSHLSTSPERRQGLTGAERRTHPRAVLSVDAACDLPRQILNDNAVVVLPMRVLGPKHDALDTRADFDTERFVNGPLTEMGDRFSVRALGTRETQRFLLGKIEANRDDVFQLTSSAASTPVFSTCAHAATSLMALHQRARQNTGYRTKFRMWVLDTRTMFAGEGVMAYAAINQMKNGASSARVIEHLQSVRRATHTVVMPTNGRNPNEDMEDFHDTPGLTRWWQKWRGKHRDAHLLLTRGGRTHTLGTRRNHREAIDLAMRIAHQAFDSDLIVPVINLSYAGDPLEIEKRHDFQYLRERAQLKKVAVLLSPMSVVGASNMGAGSLSLGFAPRTPLSN
jgi:fatty acid-binding protein DegV